MGKDLTRRDFLKLSGNGLVALALPELGRLPTPESVEKRTRGLIIDVGKIHMFSETVGNSDLNIDLSVSPTNDLSSDAVALADALNPAIVEEIRKESETKGINIDVVIAQSTGDGIRYAEPKLNILVDNEKARDQLWYSSADVNLVNTTRPEDLIKKLDEQKIDNTQIVVLSPLTTGDTPGLVIWKDTSGSHIDKIEPPNGSYLQVVTYLSDGVLMAVYVDSNKNVINEFISIGKDGLVPVPGSKTVYENVTPRMDPGTTNHFLRREPRLISLQNDHSVDSISEDRQVFALDGGGIVKIHNDEFTGIQISLWDRKSNEFLEPVPIAEDCESRYVRYPFFMFGDWLGFIGQDKKSREISTTSKPGHSKLCLYNLRSKEKSEMEIKSKFGIDMANGENIFEVVRNFSDVLSMAKDFDDGQRWALLNDRGIFIFSLRYSVPVFLVRDKDSNPILLENPKLQNSSDEKLTPPIALPAIVEI